VTLNGDFNTSFDVCVCVWLMEVLHIVFNSTNYLGGGEYISISLVLSKVFINQIIISLLNFNYTVNTHKIMY